MIFVINQFNPALKLRDVETRFYKTITAFHMSAFEMGFIVASGLLLPTKFPL